MHEDLGIDSEGFRTFFDGRFRDIVRGRKSLLGELTEFLPTIGYHGPALTVLGYWFKHDSQLNLPLLDAIRQLAKNADVEVSLATNQEHIRALHLWEHMGLRHIFADMYYAARFGEAKPDRAYFDAVDQCLTGHDEPPLFFDDMPKNVEAANKHGWEAVLFDVTEDFTDHPWVASRLSRI